MIEARGIEKTFVDRRSIRDLVLSPARPAKRTEALRGVDLAVGRGEIFGLLGPNGAGKTTLIKIFCCLVLPDRGQALIDGIDTQDEREVKRRIGLVHSDERSFYWRLSARQNLRFFARLYGLRSSAIDARIDTLLAKVDLSAAADRRFADFSSGMKQRVAIARALLHDPPILFMDEPTRSLDPASAMTLREFVQTELKLRDGKTIVLATHNLREAELLSDRLAILVGGRVRRVGSPDEVRRIGSEGPRWALEIGPGGGAIAGPFAVVGDATADGVRRVEVVMHHGASLDDLLRAVHATGGRVLACDRVETDLEQAFAQAIEAGRADA